MLGMLILGFWLALVAYVMWFLFRAKTFQPLTLDDLALMWKLHKQKTGCTASRINSMLKNGDEVIGFKCDYGYDFLQKRLITQRVHQRKMEEKV